MTAGTTGKVHDGEKACLKPDGAEYLLFSLHLHLSFLWHRFF